MLRAVKTLLLGLSAILLASPSAPPPAPDTEPDDGAPFLASPLRFDNAVACNAHLTEIVAASAPPAYDRAVGPYGIGPGDRRAHRVRARDWGHEIEEYRCLGAVLSSRRWTHAMTDVKPITIEDIGRMSFPAD